MFRIRDREDAELFLMGLGVRARAKLRADVLTVRLDPDDAEMVQLVRRSVRPYLPEGVVVRIEPLRWWENWLV
jgi:hypothetical protein